MSFRKKFNENFYLCSVEPLSRVWPRINYEYRNYNCALYNNFHLPLVSDEPTAIKEMDPMMLEHISVFLEFSILRVLAKIWLNLSGCSDLINTYSGYSKNSKNK